MALPKLLSRQPARPLPATLIRIVATYVDRTLRFLHLIATGRLAGPSGLGLALLALLALLPILTSIGQGPDTLLSRRKRSRLIAARTIAAVIASGPGFGAIRFGHPDYGLVVYALAQVAEMTSAPWGRSKPGRGSTGSSRTTRSRRRRFPSVISCPSGR